MQLISTHAPLAGRDHYRKHWLAAYWHFNPRAPCGARLLGEAAPGLSYQFQPTRPLRGATSTTLWWGVQQEISTHAPLAGRD